MDLGFQLYVVTRLDHVIAALDSIHQLQQAFITLGGFVMALLALIATIIHCCNEGEERTEGIIAFIRAVKKCAIVYGILVLTGFANPLLQSLIPTTKEGLIIAGVPALLEYQKDAVKELQPIPAKTLKLVNKYLDGQLRKPGKK